MSQSQEQSALTEASAATPHDEQQLPESLGNDMELCLSILREVLGEYDPQLLATFDQVREYAVEASAEHFGGMTDPHPDEDGLAKAVEVIDNMNLHDAQLLARAFATYFHLANLSEENYRVSVLHQREAEVNDSQAVDPVNEMTLAYHQLIGELGPAKAKELLDNLEFHPVFTAHPTEARRKAVEGKIRRIAQLLEVHKLLGGSDKKENYRRLFNEIDALFRTSPIALKKPTPVEEADTILDIFDNTLFHTIPQVYRRFDDWMLGDKAGLVPPACPAFFRPGSWIGSDRDGNPNVTAKVSRQVARKFSDHVIGALEEATRTVGKNLTMESETTPASQELKNLWSRQREMSERLTSRASVISTKETHRAVMLVMADRLHYTIERDADLMYHSCDEFLSDLRVVQRSLAEANAKRSAYGPLQDLIWQAETFGFHMVEMEFRQHSVVHARALDDIREHGLHGERGELQPMTHEVLDTFRALGAIQKRNGMKAARRYIISFTKSAQNVRDVYELNRLAFANPQDVPTLDVIPLFEQLEDLENSVNVLEEMIKIPEVQNRLKVTGGKMEVMLGYSDSSKDAGPTSATLALHSAQERIARWAESHDIDLTLFHGRGGAVGRGGGPANRAVLAQPVGSVKCRFKLTEQGEVIFARYGNPVLAIRHVESVAAATLLQSAPSVEKTNTEMTEKYADMAAALDEVSHERYLDLLNTEDFAPWFSTVTPLTEIGLLPIGSRPAKRGLGAKSLDDLRTIPWIFAWAQARVNLAAWYGLGSACEQFGDLETLRQAYKEWPLFSTFIDNIEMSIAKTDERIAKMYLALGDRDDLRDKVLHEMKLTRQWVLKIVGDEWPLQHRHVLGQAIRIRSPYVDALSVTQVLALKSLRKKVDKEELSQSQQAGFIYLILCTVSGVAAGLQNTG
ncbi:phosphoenolpyruvate carboxylase [Bifidobacterium eulemuris]|uniref:Phosphoenolpyruvate carboxylase n=1 Tax=Bifidobacterium eulemuris TaxID=1765219 RepID=A0A261GDT5_9BIFI|nr:phosphoenolpyruvate carboxylase [Bifidobacterium eulemuris]OZG69588.1 phosphoenolpyruvate carboxylase [Bifidobacterium eulemuris]QOL32294.1 phosphoenolpyruvate carboxylase [Bifidobacterium eulemuris]